MVWVATFAGWSGLVGLVVAAVTGDAPRGGFSAGISAVMYVVLSAVPTLVALWFNDWARDGFPSADERRRHSYPRADRTLRDLPAAPASSQPEPEAQPQPEGQSTAEPGPQAETPVRSWSDYAAGAGGTTVSLLSSEPARADAARAGDETVSPGEGQPPSEAR